MKRILFILTLLFSVGFTNTAAAQRVTCIPYDRAITSLIETYKEKVLYRGITNNSRFMVEIWANVETGSFTIVHIGYIEGQKTICGTIAGEGFHEVTVQPKPEKKSPKS
jgi:hypothetical protein